MSTLSIVATPIGNLEDITLRALRVLREADLILCEDTRVTKRLLDRYGISVPSMSYHARSGEAKIEKIIGLLREEKNLALVSDAGTPSISDPGSFLVSRVRGALGDMVAIVPIPGPAALTAALSAAGMPASEFLFLGFLPHKKGRETLLREIAASRRNVVIYESPHRMMRTLDALARLFGAESSRRIAICRELTKKFEEIRVGTLKDIRAFFAERSERRRGEFVIIIEGM